MNEQALIERLGKVNATTSRIYHFFKDSSVTLSDEEDSEIQHYLRTIERGLRNIEAITGSVDVKPENLDDISLPRYVHSNDVARAKDIPDVAGARDIPDVAEAKYIPDVAGADDIPEQNVCLFNESSCGTGQGDGIKVEEKCSEITVIKIEPIEECEDQGRDKDVTQNFLEGLDDDAFGDDDFDEDALQQIEEAEKSVLDVSGGDEIPDIPEEDDTEHQPSEQKYLDVLKQYFGYSKFRPLQWKIIDSILNQRKDNCVIMATGYGKSLCYQYPSVYTGGTTIVISPLISLMEDQVLALSAANIKACFLGTAQTESGKVMSEIKRNAYRVVYITPEFAAAATSFLKEVHDTISIDLIAVDEAHCVSQWGHDFRASYRTLGNLRSTLTDVPMLAVTATATPQVMRDICKSLYLRQPNFTYTGFDRPNLYLSVSMKSGDVMDDLRSQMFDKDGRVEFEGPTIIYCPTKKATEDTLQYVKRLGVPAGLYHAGRSMSERKKTHKQFINDEIQVVVATVAFGMGIDKPDVRQIIHYGAPKDLEAFYQEIGRAGRDGLQSFCHVFYNRADFNTSRFFLKDILNEKHREHKQAMMAKMEYYLVSSSCRRKSILSHFESKPLHDIGRKKGCCDNCSKRLEQKRTPADEEINYGKEALQLFKAIRMTGESFGMMVPIYFLRGSTSQRLPKKFHNTTDHGVGRNQTEKWWKAFGRQLTTEGYLKEVPIQGGFGCTVILDQKARSWMAKNLSADAELKMTPNLELEAEENPRVPMKPTILPTVPSNSWLSSRESLVSNITKTQASPGKKKEQLKKKEKEKELYTKLVGFRNKMSVQRGLPAYVLVSNKSLSDMARVRPTTMESLLKIEDFPVEKAQQYGPELLEFVAGFCKEKSMITDSIPEDVDIEVKMEARLKDLISTLRKTVQITYILFECQKQKLQMEQVCSRRGLTGSSIVRHLCEAIKVGLPVDLDRVGVDEKMVNLITQTIRKPPINSDVSRLTPIREQLPDHVQFDHIRIVLAVLCWQFGMSDCLINFATTEVMTMSCYYGASSSSSEQPHTHTPPHTPSVAQKRKLPEWMTKTSPPDPSASQPTLKKNTSLSKKMKQNSLFRR